MQFNLPNGTTINKNSFTVNLWIKLAGACRIGKIKTKLGDLEYFAFRCRQHGIQIDYEHGYNYRLDCPKCLESSLQ